MKEIVGTDRLITLNAVRDPRVPVDVFNAVEGKS